MARATRFVGFGNIRGSSTRGGVAALRKMFREGQSTNLTMTPDGPRGPRRELATGCIYLASRLQLPIVPLGLGYDRPWRLQRPHGINSQSRDLEAGHGTIMGPGIRIPAEANRDN
ncbi:MAG: DUF374 domain-containing protein [Pirellulaceae bacterium]